MVGEARKDFQDGYCVMSIPMVSVVVPTYNGIARGYLRDALQSVLQQDFRDFEVIIVDDGSKDDIAAGICDLLSDGRLRLIRRENGGLAAARRTGIEAARGRYIALLDDDDRWAPEKLRAQLSFFEQHADDEIAMVFTGVRLIDADGKVVGLRRKYAHGRMYDAFVLHGNGVTAPSAVMFKRAVVGDVGNFDPNMRSLEDLDMWLRIAQKYAIYSIPEVLTDYRVHAESITAKDFSREEAYERKLYERILENNSAYDRVRVFANMYSRFAVRHLSLGNYAMARAAFAESLSLSFTLTRALAFVCLFCPPGFLSALRDMRRRSKLFFEGLRRTAK
jgi:glycosyltransferase involved in cell wall biosynthesis